MNLKIVRKYRKDTYTIGNLFVDGVWLCNSLEDKDRGLKQTDSIIKINGTKVYAETAIPIGTYNVRMDIVSPKYSASSWYKSLCGGKVPRIENVPGFLGVLIHTGNTALDSAGCVLVGLNKKKGALVSSKECFSKLYKKMEAAYKKGEKITLQITW